MTITPIHSGDLFKYTQMDQNYQLKMEGHKEPKINLKIFVGKLPSHL